MKKIISLFLVLFLVAIVVGCDNNRNQENDNLQTSQNQNNGNNKDNSSETKNNTVDNTDKGADPNSSDENGNTNPENDNNTSSDIEKPKREDIDGGVKFTFEQLPKNSDEISKIVDFKDEKYVAALFLATFVTHLNDSEEAIKMVNVLKGPQPLSDSEISFFNDQMEYKPHLHKAYFEGATPENNYTPDEPLSVIIYDDKIKPSEEGYIRVFVEIKGADNPRYIKLRQKGDEWFIWEYYGILMSIKSAAESDPWK